MLVLDKDARASLSEIAQSVGVSRNTVHARLQRLEDSGLLDGYSMRATPESLGLPMIAFISLQIEQSKEDDVVERLSRIPEVVELHFTTGDADLFARVVARDTDDLHRVMSLILKTPGVTRSSTRVSLGRSIRLRFRPLLERVARGGK